MPDRVTALADDALGADDAVGLVERLRAGRVSAAELVEAAVGRIEGVDPRLAAIACERYERARTEAREPAGGFFSGVPTLIKDNCDVAGLPTQQGSTSYAARPARADGDVARLFGALGTITLAKTRLSEFGFSAAAEFVDAPPVRNPWHTDHVSGASSAGSAALVAAGAVPFAHANDGGGSIRIPAACCGLVGLKPTRDRTASDAMVRQMPVRIVADGVVTRSVRDTAAWIRESEKAYRRLALPPVGDLRGPGRRRLRVALVTESIGGRGVDAETLAAVRDTARLLDDAGHHVEEVPPPVPDSFADDFLDYWSMLALHMTTTGRVTLDRSFRRADTDNLTRGLARHARRRSWRLPAAIARLGRSHVASRRFYADHDVALSPVLSRPAPSIGWLSPTQEYDVIIERLLEWVSFTPLQNATGDPAISLPATLSAAGLPIGVQLAAPRGYDGRLIELAYEIEAARPFPRIAG